jgi:hypothetical protein
MDADSFDVVLNGQTSASFGADTTIGPTSGKHIKITGTALEIKTDANTTALSASAAGLEMSGKVKATSGEIGGFTVGSDLTAAAGTLKLKGVTGQITGSAAKLTGGNIGGFIIEGNQIRGTIHTGANRRTSLTLESGQSARVGYDGNDGSGIIFGTDSGEGGAPGLNFDQPFTGSAWVVSDSGGPGEGMFFRAGVKNTYLKLTSINGEETGVLQISASNFSIDSGGTVKVRGLEVASSALGVGATPSATAGHIRATDDIVAFYSDERLKEKITIGIENPIDKIKNINTFTYKHNELANTLGFKGDKIYIGVGAKAVKESLPEAVEVAPFDANEDGSSKSGEDYLTVQYERLVPLLIEAIKEQQEQIVELKQQIEEIKDGMSK